jgi:hypothetical protein
MATEDDQAEKSEGWPMAKEQGGQAAMLPKGHLRHPHGQVQRRQSQHQGVQKLDHLEYQTGQSNFLESGQHLCSRELVQQMILDFAVWKFRRSGSSSVRLSSGVLLLSQATNTWAVGDFADDVPTLSSIGRVVQTMGATATDAFSPGIVRTYSRSLSWRLLRRRWPLRTCRPPTGHEGLRTGKLDSPEYQTRPFGFLGDSHNSWSPA